ncbi:MAG TPA: HD domain-containing protein, partial [Allosphingosinicella sp.]
MNAVPRLGLNVRSARPQKRYKPRLFSTLRAAATSHVMRDGLKNSVFRDNIRDNRLIEVPPEVRRIIGTKDFQRLRRVRQMGLSYLVFPTAEHSRFSHSIGVYATAREFFHKLRIKADELTIEVPALQFNEAAEKSFCAAAMCHDLGHTAFSHVLEKTLLPASVRRHEDCSIRLLRESPELRDAVEEYTGDLNSVALFIDRERDHPNLALNTLISGPFDVDRADYLIRDSQAAGVRY